MACTRHADGMQPAVEMALAYHLLPAAVLVNEPAGFVNIGAKKVGAHQGMIITSAVDSSTWESSRWRKAFKNSSHEQ